MTLPRSRVKLRTSNIARRGRYNSELNDNGGIIAGDAEPAPGGGSDPPTVPLPDLKADVVAFHAAHPAEFALHCTQFDYLDLLVPFLQAIDVRVGWCWRPERNDYALDALTYYHGIAPPIEDSTNVYVVDVIGSKCAPDAKPAWTDVTTPAAVRQWRQFRV